MAGTRSGSWDLLDAIEEDSDGAEIHEKVIEGSGKRDEPLLRTST
jgi:hypothetical protein